MGTHPNALERETVYSLLADESREYLLWHLSAVEETTTDAAAEGIAACKSETGAEPREDGRRSIAVRLVHDHLPRLDRHDVVDYDPATDEIERGPNFDDLEPYVADLELPVNPRSISN
ncbi:DUF7344 domain-containing protein [Haloterrigena alkaliphila]|uniref:DUF7344 domain-containing protein n=1 Tax=Haloterrigena alkaliphila TaxID=2816475 RepID=A0A8A2VEV4_9EURY|nr:hypothetical protein [Haloterrigena alkaliphila]QSW99207.1 hypothetical protein J0X25_17800 [Haloterrigena alkaliphila]